VALRLLENLDRILTRFTNLIFYIHSSRALWMGDQPIARPVPTQESTTLKDEKKHECLQQDSNPQSQYPSGQGLCLMPRGQCVRRPFSISNVKQVIRCSTVSIVSGYGWTTGRSRLDPRQRQRIFPLASVSRPAVGPTQPPVQWVPGVLSRG
jgi:hypothetical protein